MTEVPKPCELTAQQEKLWNDTRVALIWHCPAFSHIFYTMLDTVGSKYVARMTRDVPVAATDGSSLLINPDTFFKYNLQQRVFIIAHEIAHCMFDHMGQAHKWQRAGKVGYPSGKSLPYDHDTMNVAMDLVVNDMLIQSKIGEFSKDWLHDTNLATYKDSVVDAYAKVFKNGEGCVGGTGTGTGTGAGTGQFDQHLAPGTSKGQDPTAAQQGRNQVEWQTQIAAAYATAKAQGKLPAAMATMFEELMNPQVDWREKIRGIFMRKVGSGAYDWRRPDRRLIVRDIYAPSRSGYGADCVVVAGDSSGSITQKEADMFFGELSGILEDVRPRRLFFLWCDADVQQVFELHEPGALRDVRAKGVIGRGGTSFVPVFEWVAKEGLHPDALVYLTDGYGSFPPKTPNFPVIWGSTSKDVKYPFGEVVNLPVSNA